jgi:flavin-binding protein dodecin
MPSDVPDWHKAINANATKENIMSVAKIIEISAESPISFMDAIEIGIDKAVKTVHNIKSAWIQDQQVLIKNNKIIGFRVDMKITFVLDR